MEVNFLTVGELEKFRQEILLDFKQCISEVLSQANNSEDYLTAEQVRQLLDISPKQFQKYRDERLIPFSQFGRKIYVRRSDLTQFLDDHRIEKKRV